MSDLVLKLIDRCVHFLKIRKEDRKAAFTEYAVPLLEDLEALHRNYLETFEKYRVLIQESKTFTLNHPVFDLITKDHVFT